MKIEVDNTTQQLLSELQSSIRGTISIINKGQEDIKETIDEMKETLIEMPSARDIREMREDVNETSKKSVQNVKNSLEEIQMSISSLEKGIIDEEKFKLLVVGIANYKKAVDEISNNINKEIADILNSQNELSENYYRDVSRIEEDRAESFRLLNEKIENQGKRTFEQVMKIVEPVDKKLDDVVDKKMCNTLMTEIFNNRDTLVSLDNNVSDGKEEIIKLQTELLKNAAENLSTLIGEIKKDNQVLLDELLNAYGKSEEELKRTLATYVKTKELEELVEKLRGYIEEQYHLLEEEYLRKLLERIDSILSHVIKHDACLEQFEKQTLSNLEKMLNDFSDIENLEVKNNQYLKDIVNYMMLPGYKRFFKGMETSYEESER